MCTRHVVLADVKQGYVLNAILCGFLRVRFHVRTIPLDQLSARDVFRATESIFSSSVITLLHDRSSSWSVVTRLFFEFPVTFSTQCLSRCDDVQLQW